MERKTAIALAIVMLVILAWGLFFASNTVIVVNGQEVGGPLGLVVIAALFLGALSSPFLLIMLIPLAILWLFVAMTRRTKTS